MDTKAFNSEYKPSETLHLGLAAQLHHDYGKREIIDTLNAHGFVIGYDELRRFMTAVGEKEQEKNEGQVNIPHGLIPRQEGGSLIQEGADNIDINCETIDGKGTFHAMARVVFQQQSVVSLQAASLERVPHGRRKSLSPTTSGFHQIIPYKKPSRRPEPPRLVDAIRRLKNLKLTVSYEAADLSWVLMRAAPRQQFPMRGIKVTGSDVQNTSFWTGANAQVAERSTAKTTAAYAPIPS